MRITAVLLAVLASIACAAPGNPPAPGIPDGWKLVLEEHFDTVASLRRLECTDPTAWQFAADDSSHALELARQSRYEPPVRSPVNIALLSGIELGDFILEVDLLQTGREYGHRDMCVFLGLRDPSHFYYVHLATEADDHAHNIFLVDGAPRRKIAERSTTGVKWGQEVWHRIRIERRVSTGLIRVFFDDLATPIMETHDTRFVSGRVGFGSFDDTGKVDSIRIWSPQPITTNAPVIFKGWEPKQP
jgi:hypothetical protein